MDLEKIKALPKVVFTNDDYSFPAFLKSFVEKDQFSNGNASLRCKKSAVTRSLGSKLKKVEL